MRRKSDCGFIGLQQLQQLQHEQQQQQQQHHRQQQLQHHQGRPRRNRSLDRSNDRLHGKIPNWIWLIGVFQNIISAACFQI